MTTNMTNAVDLYAQCKNLVIDIGKTVEVLKEKKFKVIRKSSKELVTEIDLAVQKSLAQALKSINDCPIFFEEDKSNGEGKLPSECFIVDPIDATHNFIAGLPFYNISIGYVKGNEIIFGIVYFPDSQDIYHAFKGKGAFKNQEKIVVSGNFSLEKSIVAYDNQFHLDKDIMANYQKLLAVVFTTRILGSANRDACFVAEGILDARIWNATKMFDIVAGAIIVNEAGGSVSDFNGQPINILNARKVIMSNSAIHKDLLNVFVD